MSCTTLTELLKSCDANNGGIYTAYVFDMEQIDTSTYVESASTFTVTALDLLPHEPAMAFEFKRNTSDFTDDAQINLTNGSTFYKKTIQLVFHRREALKSKSIKILGEGQRYLGVVIGTANGQFWYFPYMQLSAVTGGSGKARGDGSNYNITLIGEDEHSAYEMSANLAAQLIVPQS